MIKTIFSDFYNDKKVLITGHTGFKGSWLSIWLNKLGAHVTGYALAPETEPNNYTLTGIERKIESFIKDIRDYNSFQESIEKSNPEIIFHLAAQPLVRESYKDPLKTFSTNIIGLVNLFEIVRKIKTIKAVLIITSDKCYLNRGWLWGYKETDELGGYDPYSASKACAEILASSYRKSFFNNENIKMATARAGNVIGGGDWSKDRIIPDCIRGIINDQKIQIRNPYSIRPWQYVLEPLSGYLSLMINLYEGKELYADSWNFGPKQFESTTVLDVVNYFISEWKGSYELINSNEKLHEASLLQLDCSKAFHQLKWQPVLSTSEALKYTVEWYKKFYTGKIHPYELCINQIDNYMRTARERNISWAFNDN